MEYLVELLKRIEYCWLNFPWPGVIGVVFGCVALGHNGYGVWATLLAAALWWFIVYTWPQRWLLDVFIILVALQWLGEWLAAVHLPQQWISHL